MKYKNDAAKGVKINGGEGDK